MTWLLFTTGRGPVECQAALAELCRVLAAEGGALGLEVSVLDIQPGPHGPESFLASVEGPEADAFCASWTGTVQWTCPSPLRRTGRKNWFVGVSRLDPPNEGSALHDRDIEFTATRASGPGGQHVNKTSSAVRAVHRPSGISVLAREERSQHRNKALAVARIASMLDARGEAAAGDAERERWSRHDELERGNPVRRYDGPDFRRR